MRTFFLLLLAFLALGLIPLHAQPTTASQDSGKTEMTAPPGNAKRDTVYVERTDKAIERQFGLYDFILKTFSIILAVFAVGSVIGGYIGYRDRQAMKEEYREKKKELDDLIAQKKKELEDLVLQNTDTINKLIKDSESGLNEKRGIFESYVAQKITEIDNRCMEAGINIGVKEKELDGRVSEVFDKAAKYEAAIAEKTPAPPSTAPQEVKDAVVVFDQGVEFYEASKLKEAIIKWKEAIRLNPDLAEAHNNLGVALGAQGETDGEIAEYSKAIELNPDFAEAHYNLGCCYALQGDKENAFESLSKAIEKGEDDWPLMEKDPDLNSLRDDPRFKALAEKVKARWEEKQRMEGKGK